MAEAAAQAPAYVAPQGMGDLTRDTAQDWINTHLNPNVGQMTHLLVHVYEDLNDALTVCKLSQRQKYAVLRQGVTTIDDMVLIGSSVVDVRNTFKAFNTLADGRGGVNFGAIHYQRVFALINFAKDKKRRGKEIVADDFTAAEMEKYIQQAEIKDSSKEKSELETTAPPTLGENNFHKWERAVYTNLLAKVGVREIPLAYVVRKDTQPETFADDQEQLIYEASRTGPSWDDDNKAVGNYITSLLTGKPAETWIKDLIPSQNGRGMMAALRVHFLGESQKERIVEDARRRRDGAYFKSQAIYTFEKFASELQEAFTTLAEYDDPVSPNEQLRLLRHKINTENDSFNASVNTVLMDHTRYDTFQKAVAQISVLVDQYFPAVATKTRGRVVASVDVSNFATSSNNGRLYFEGIDITDFTRYYKPQEWSKLSKELRDAIMKAKQEKGGTGTGGGGGRGKAKAKKREKKAIKAAKKKAKTLNDEVATLKKTIAALSEVKTQTGRQQEQQQQQQQGGAGTPTEATGPNAFAPGPNR